MAQVALIQQQQAQARAGTLDVEGMQELKDLKTDMAIAKGACPDVVLLLGAACRPAAHVPRGFWHSTFSDTCMHMHSLLYHYKYIPSLIRSFLPSFLPSLTHPPTHPTPSNLCMQ